MTVIPVAVCVLVTVPKGFERRLEGLENHRKKQENPDHNIDKVG